MNTRLTLAPNNTFLETDTHLLLREDVKEEVESGREPLSREEFQAKRPEYGQLTGTFFGKRLHQERRYRKFCIYMDEKRSRKDPYASIMKEDAYYGNPLEDEDEAYLDEEDSERPQDENRVELKKKQKKKN